VAKFSGGQVEKGILERGYTLVEDIFNKNKSSRSDEHSRIEPS